MIQLQVTEIEQPHPAEHGKTRWYEAEEHTCSMIECDAPLGYWLTEVNGIERPEWNAPFEIKITTDAGISTRFVCDDCAEAFEIAGPALVTMLNTVSPPRERRSDVVSVSDLRVGMYVPKRGWLVHKEPHSSGFHVRFQRAPWDVFPGERWSRFELAHTLMEVAPRHFSDPTTWPDPDLGPLPEWEPGTERTAEPDSWVDLTTVSESRTVREAPVVRSA